MLANKCVQLIDDFRQFAEQYDAADDIEKKNTRHSVYKRRGDFGKAVFKNGFMLSLGQLIQNHPLGEGIESPFILHGDDGDYPLVWPTTSLEQIATLTKVEADDVSVVANACIVLKMQTTDNDEQTKYLPLQTPNNILAVIGCLATGWEFVGFN